MPNNDLLSFLNAAADAKSSIATQSAAVVNAGNTQAAIEQETANAQLAIGANNQIIQSADQNAQLAVQNAKLKVGNTLGVNMLDVGEIITAASDRMNSAYREKMAATDKISALNKKSMLSDPLGWVMSRFELSDTIEAHNNAVDKYNEAEAFIADKNRLGQAAATLQDQFKQSVTTATIAATTDNAARQAAMLANQAKIQALGYNINALNASINATKEQLAIDFNANNAKNQAASLANAQAHLAIAKAEFDYKKSEREDAAITDESMIAEMQKGANILFQSNAPQFPAGSKQAKVLLAQLKMGGEVGAQAREMLFAGRYGVAAGNPSQAIVAIKSNVPIAFTPVQVPVKDILSRALEAIPATVDKKDKDAVAAAINKNVAEQIADFKNEVKVGDKDNPFNIPTANELIKLPGVSATELTQKVLAPLAAAGNDLSDPNKVLNATYIAIKAGKISMESAAADYAYMYQKGYKVNAAQRDFIRVGINPGLPSYRTRIETSPGQILGRSSIVENTNSQDVLRALMQLRTSEIIDNQWVAR